MCKFTLKPLYSLLLHRFFVKCNSARFLHPTSLENKCTQKSLYVVIHLSASCAGMSFFTFLLADFVECKVCGCFKVPGSDSSSHNQHIENLFLAWWWDWRFNMSWAFQALCIRSELLWSLYAYQVFTKSVPYVVDLPLKLAGGRLSQSPKMRACATFALTMYSPSSLVQHSIIWQPLYKLYKLCKADCNLTVTLLIQHSWTKGTRFSISKPNLETH